MYRFRLALLMALAVPVGAVTLEQLSLDDMIQKSTAIVRGRVTGSYGAARGSIIYTHYRISVLERWKGAAAADLDIVVPGGIANGLHQAFGGAPKLSDGGEYVLFLWTGSSGLTNIIGLSQGVLNVRRDAKTGASTAWRAATTETMLDSAGRLAKDEPVEIRLDTLRDRITATLARSARK